MSKNYTSRMEKREQRKKKGKSLWKKLLLVFAIAFLLIMVVGAVSVAVMIHDAPELSEDNLQFPQSTRIYDEDGEQIDTLFHEENRINVSIDDVPDEVRNAILSIEDKRFYDHKGIDVRRLAGAAISNVKNGWGAEGGSTLTQQVIKRTVLTPEKTLKRKVQEAWLALKLERKYSKEEILELYLNNVYFGHGAYGIKTASATYFGEEDLSDLNISQIALLAGLPNSPSATDPFKHPEKAEERRDRVLEAMENNGVITAEEGAEAKDLAISDIILDEEKEQKNGNLYNAYVDAVYEQLVEKEEVVSDDEFFQGGLRIYTHLDTDAQKSAYDLLHSEDIAYPDDNFEAGLTLVDTETGAVKAVGGGRNFQAVGYTNYGSNVKHTPGSTIKPILDYAPAIDYLQWSTSHTLSDEPYEYSDGSPINEWDGEYWGDVTIRRALEWSRNIPALKAFQAVGEDKAQEFAAGLGIDIDPIYESAAIGTEPVSPLQMAAGYASFGNGGTYNEPSTVKKIVYPDGKEWEPDLESEKAMEDYTAYMITDMLKTVMTTGTGTQANIDGLPVAGKTGSTNIAKEDRDKYGIDDGLRDAWFSGYTTEYSLAVWTGYPSLKNDDGDVQYIKYDGTQDIAKHLFKELMSTVSSEDTADFIQPKSVVASGSELFVRSADSSPPADNPSEPSNEEPQEEPEEEESDDEEEEEESDDEANNEEEENEEENEENNEENNQDNNNGEESDSNEENQDSNDQNNDQNQGNDQNNDNQQNDGNNQDGNDGDGGDGGNGGNDGDGQNNGNDEGGNNQNGNNGDEGDGGND